MAYIGIDFGTSNSVVANFQYGQAEVLANHEGQRWTPSVVTLRRDGSLAFGQEAKENFDEQRSIRSIKRILCSPRRRRCGVRRGGKRKLGRAALDWLNQAPPGHAGARAAGRAEPAHRADR